MPSPFLALTYIIPKMIDGGMGIRIRLRDIDIPKDEPFKHDLLGRQEPAEVLTNLVDCIADPCVLAIDAPWGAGKTTFLKMWTRHLRNQGFPVVEFNAWETDFSEDPFLTLSIELTEGLQSWGSRLPSETLINLSKSSKKVLRWVVPSAIRVASSSVPGVGKELGESAASYVEEKLSGHVEARKSVAEFRQVLQNTAVALSEKNENRPLMIVIDELDRCRPSYAVELLEMAKHLFSVDRIVFVLSINRGQLAHSVKVLYGSDFDAQGYLRRYFDLDFRLPEPRREAFIDAHLQATGITDYFGQAPENPSYVYLVYFAKEVERKERGDKLRKMLLTIFGGSTLSLRTIGQAIHRLGLLYASLGSQQQDLAITTTVALVFRTVDPENYHRFNRGVATDLEVVNAFFEQLGQNDLRYGEWGGVFEVTIILAGLEDVMADMNRSEVYNSSLSSPGPIHTPLLDWYRNKQQTVSKDTENGGKGYAEARLPEYKHAEQVFNRVKQAIVEGQEQIGYRQAVQRLELLSTTLFGQQSDMANASS